MLITTVPTALSCMRVGCTGAAGPDFRRCRPAGAATRDMIGIVLLSIAAAAMTGQPVIAQSRVSVTDERDRFAIAHLAKVQRNSIRENVEYCGLFGRDESGRLVATKAVKGGPNGCEPEEAPDNVDVIASYHTHGAWTILADTEVPSVEDLLSDFEEEIDGYIATPGGRVWQVRLENRKASLLCGRKCVPADPNYRDCKALPVAREYTVATLRTRAARDTGLC